MFDIKVGTLISSTVALTAIPKLNPCGFETYEIQMYKNQSEADVTELSEKLKDVLDGREISALAFYENPLMNDVDYEQVKMLIRNAHKFGCRTLCLFAGHNSEKPVDQMIPYFKERYTPLVKLAEDNGVRNRQPEPRLGMGAGASAARTYRSYTESAQVGKESCSRSRQGCNGCMGCYKRVRHKRHTSVRLGQNTGLRRYELG